MSEKSPGLVVFKNANLITGTGAEPLSGGSLVVEGERIKQVSAGSPGRVPARALVIDCGGKTLMPGLIDAHVHVGAVEADITNQQRSNFSSVLVLKTARVMKETLDQGFTTVRDAGGADAGYRQAVGQGLIPGPRMNVCGRCLSQTGGHADGRLPTESHPPSRMEVGVASVVCDGVDAVRLAAREQIRRHVDHVKIMGGGGAMSPADEVDTAQYSLEEIRAIVFEAENAGKYVSAHCYSPRSIRQAAQSGVRTIEHGNLLDQATALIMKETGAILVPTIVTYEMLSKLGRDFGVPENNIRKINQVREAALEAVALAMAAGVTIGSGSDLLGPMQVYKAGELELQAKVMGPMGALVAATKTNAEILRWENDLGTLEEGKLADLLVVDGDPLADIAILQQYQDKIAAIMQGGRFHKNIL